MEKKSIELGNIAVSRDFSDVRDVAAVYAKLATEKPVEGPVNLCSGVSTSLQSVIMAMKKISGLDIQIEVNTALLRDGDVLTMRGDRTKLGRLVKAQTRSLEETLAWMYYETRNWQSGHWVSTKKAIPINAKQYQAPHQGTIHTISMAPYCLCKPSSNLKPGRCFYAPRIVLRWEAVFIPF